MVAELHWRICGIATFGAVVHLHSLVFSRMENVLPDILCTVRSEVKQTGVRDIILSENDTEKSHRSKYDSQENRNTRHPQTQATHTSGCCWSIKQGKLI